MGEVVAFPRYPVAAIIVGRTDAGAHPYRTTARTRTLPNKPSVALGQPWFASSFESALSIAEWLSARNGLPVLIEPGAHCECRRG